MDPLEACVLRYMNEFYRTVCDRYRIPENDLKNIFFPNKSMNKKTKQELVQLCRDRNLSFKGTKAELIARLEKQSDSVQTKIRTQQPIIYLYENSHGYFVHPDTRFVFHRPTERVIGKQADEEKIVPLSRSDIEVCHLYGFQYVCPENLNEDILAKSQVMDDSFYQEILEDIDENSSEANTDVIIEYDSMEEGDDDDGGDDLFYDD